MHEKTVYYSRVSNCDRRKLDLERVRQYLAKNGFVEVEDPREAHNQVIMTCATTGANIAESEAAISKVEVMASPEATIIVGGCLPQRYTASDEKVTLHFNPIDGFEHLEALLGLEGRVADIPDSAILGDSPHILDLRIQDGCKGNCNYCAIRDVIGSARSKSVETILFEMHSGLRPSVEFIRLTGDDVGTYGLDCNSDLIALLDTLEPTAGVRPFIIDNLDPKYLVEMGAGFIAYAERGLLHHMKVPLQHFHRRVLEAMNRYSDTERITQSVMMMAGNGVHLQTHFVVGYPTETFTELRQAAKALVALPFGQIAFIPYQNHPGAPSFMLPQVSTEELKRRMDYLEASMTRHGSVTRPYLDPNTGIQEVKVLKPGYHK